MNDLRQVYQYFSRTAGSTSASYRPTCLDPLRDGGRLCLKPQEKVELLGENFSQKLMAPRAEGPEEVRKLRKEMRKRFPEGTIEFTNKITLEEIQLAAKDPPKNKAAGPDLILSEKYHYCASTREEIRRLFTQMLESATIPEKLRHFS